MTERPLIFVCNDDGIDADGLWLLAEALTAHGEVMVVAPAFNQSGMSAAFTLHRDLGSERAHSRLAGVDAWQVSGTPTDAVVLGLRRHARRRVAMIVAGVNPGPNVGRDILHSGTVMAAMQGYLRGLPSVAVSSASFDGANLDAAAHIGADVAGWLLARGGVQLLNVNVPNLPRNEIVGVEVTCTGDVSLDRVIDFTEPDGTIRRQLVRREDIELPEGADVTAIIRGAISITPLDNDITAHAALAQTRAAITELELL